MNQIRINAKKLIELIIIRFKNLTPKRNDNTIPIWPQSIPGSISNFDYLEKELTLKTSKVITPNLSIYLSSKNKTSKGAILIFPGGGYEHLSINKEGIKVAKWLNNLGISAFVLKYRLPNDLIMKDKTIGPLQDAQEAIRIIRRNAKKWKIDTTKIGVIGFSAGGHLASTLSTQFEKKVYESDDTISARPDFTILIYPVISMKEGITHNRSKINLLGVNASQELIDNYSNEKQIDKIENYLFTQFETENKNDNVILRGTLIEPKTDETPRICIAKIAKSTPMPP